MSKRQTSQAIPSVTSSLASVDGRLPFDGLVCPTIRSSGLAHVPASRSRRPVGVTAKTMSVISGLSGGRSSKSAALQLSLANKLAEKLDCHGLTVYQMTWKTQITPLRRRICALLASVRPIFGKGFSSLPTVTARDWRYGMKQATVIRRAQHARGVNLNEYMQRQIGRPGKINPALACLMMGYPIAFYKAACAVSETPLSRKSRPRSSKPTVTPEVSK